MSYHPKKRKKKRQKIFFYEFEYHVVRYYNQNKKDSRKFMGSSCKNFTCIECSDHFKNSDVSLGMLWKDKGFPSRIGICSSCREYGPDVGLKRRNWDMKPDEEHIEYGENAHEIVADRIALAIQRESSEPEKTKWLHIETIGMWKGYVYLRAWQNTLREKISHGNMFEISSMGVVYFSKSQKKKICGWISNIKDGLFTVTRRPSKQETENAQKKNKTIPKIMNRPGLKFEDLYPPISIQDKATIPEVCGCNGLCGLAYLKSSLKLGKDLGWGNHLSKGGHNMFCQSCLPERAIPEKAGAPSPDFHIGFCKSAYCGCWGCSASDLRCKTENRCGDCGSMSCDGWIDRKTGEDTWFCRICWIGYYEEHKLVRLCDVDKAIKDTSPSHYDLKKWGWSNEEIAQSKKPNLFDGIWIGKRENVGYVSREKVNAVKKFHECYRTGNWSAFLPEEAYFTQYPSSQSNIGSSEEPTNNENFYYIYPRDEGGMERLLFEIHESNSKEDRGTVEEWPEL